MFKWLQKKGKPKKSTHLFKGFPKLNAYLLYSHMLNAEPRLKLRGYWING